MAKEEQRQATTASNGSTSPKTKPKSNQAHSTTTYVVTTDGAAIDGNMLDAAEHHRGRSSSFSHKEDDVHHDAVEKSHRTASIVGAIALLAVSYLTLPENLQPVDEPTVQHVWYYGWITAISTGLGVLPLVFVPNLDKFWIGISNAVAAGMMIAASYSLITEGCTFSEPTDTWELSSTYRTILGVALGLVFIYGTKQFLDTHEDYKVGSLGDADARKIILIMFVMTLHSFSEGVGIGVSFGGAHGKELGAFISASLAVHNVPEGLAVAIVLLPRKVSKLSAALWCVLTSLPQPVMAVPAYLFVHYFIPVLPIGLGFAGGAMAWVALFELLVEAYEDTDAVTTGIIAAISSAVMMTLQNYIKDD